MTSNEYSAIEGIAFCSIALFFVGVFTFLSMLFGPRNHNVATRNNKEQSIQSEANHVYSNSTGEGYRDSATPETKSLNSSIAETQSPESNVPETKNSDLNTSETRELESYGNPNTNQETVIYFSGGKLRIVGQE
ncbi:hypothetical protein EUA79_00835 [TM7 phylum sp. oral taxon 351]|nr:hypothetical protein EUA79_00835 [TM7 phylum sp. oral taxon 351]